MTSTVTLFQNVLPVSNSPTQNYRPPAASPLADRQHVKQPPQQGSNFTGTSGTTIQFRVPSINKLVAADAGFRFGFNLHLKDPTKSFISEGASSFIQTITVQTTSGELLERLDYYNTWCRLNANITIPAWQKSTALGVCAGYTPQTPGSYAAVAGRGSGHYEVQLHSMVLSNATDLPLKMLGGLIVEITLA